MQIALVATMLFALLWFVALRPKPADGGGGAAAPAPTPSAQQAPAAEPPAAPGADGLANAVDRAQDAVATGSGDAQRAERSDAEASARDAGGGPQAPEASGGTSQATAATPASAADGGATPRATPAERRAAAGPVRTALRQRKALALAFVDPRTADARAVRRELSAVSRFGGRAVVLAVPISQLSRYELITREVKVTVAPTVVIVSPKHTATTIVGFADRGEIEQRLADALAAPR